MYDSTSNRLSGAVHSISRTQLDYTYNKGALIGSSLTYAEWRAQAIYV